MFNNILKMLMLSALVIQGTLAHAQGILYTGGDITPERPLISANGNYQLEVTDLFGAFGVSRSTGKMRAVFAMEVDFAMLNRDGNLVAYATWGDPLWSTNTAGAGTAQLQIYDDGNMILRQTTTHGDLVIFELGPETTAEAGEPTKIGDVVGRDMDIPILGGIGHLGVWDGEFIIEAVPGYTNAIRPVGVQVFKAQTKYWGVASPNIPEGLLQAGCYETFCTTRKAYSDIVQARVGIAKRARQVMALGAEYTSTGNVIHADFEDEQRPAQRGMYRCDSFVVHMLNWSTHYQVSNSERKMWSKRMTDLIYGPSITPTYVFNQLKTFY